MPVKPIADVLAKALELLGENGEYFGLPNFGGLPMCAAMAIGRGADSLKSTSATGSAIDFLAKELGRDVAEWSDECAKRHDFAAVKAALLKAIAKLRADVNELSEGKEL